MGFSTFRDRDAEPRPKKSRKNTNGKAGAMDEDSDDDDDDDISDKMLADDEDNVDPSKQGPEDVKFTGELADGVNRIKVCGR